MCVRVLGVGHLDAAFEIMNFDLDKRHRYLVRNGLFLV